MKQIDLHGINYIELVQGGTDAWYWATDYIHGDLYEAEDLFRQGHQIQSNTLYLVHYPDGTVFEPISKVDGQYIGLPVYANGDIILLAVNFDEEQIRILRFVPQQNATEEIVQLPLSIVTDCYNLMLHNSPLMLTRQSSDNFFEIIWPEQVRFAIEARESFNFREDEKLYFTLWNEDPDYWEETIVRSLPDGTIIERYVGDIRIMPNGDKWLIR